MAAGRIVVPGWMPALDSNGAPIPNAQIYIYLNGTTTIATVYSDDTLTTPIANPVEANSSGQFPEIWADDANLFSISVDAPFGPPGIPFTFDSIGPATVSAVIEVATDAANAVVAGKANKAGDTFTGTLKSDLQNLAPPQYVGIQGSLGTSAAFEDIRRTGGFGAYGHDLTTVLVTASLGADQLDSGKTAWVTMQNMAVGSIGAFGGWSGANSPSSSLGGQTFAGGSIIGHEFNVGNRWGDLGLQTALTGHDFVGAQFVPDVVPAADGTTAPIYPGTFAFAVAKSIHGHKWWTGPFVGTDSIMAGGYANLTSGGSTSGNAPQAAHKFQGNFVDGIDFSTAVFTSSGRELKWSDVSISRGTTPGRLLIRGLGDIPLLNIASTASATAYLEIRNQVGSAEFTAQSLTLTDVPFKIASKGAGPLDLYYGPTLAARFQPAASGETSMWLLDGTSNTLKRVTVGAADSGGSGFRVLRVAN